MKGPVSAMIKQFAEMCALIFVAVINGVVLTTHGITAVTRYLQLSTTLSALSKTAQFNHRHEQLYVLYER